MSLESIYYIGQTISVLAVVLSLVFVGLQIRRAEASARAAAAETTHQRFAEWYQLQTQPSVADLAVRGNSDIKSFSADERYAYICNVMAALLAIQDAHRKWIDGSLPDGLWRVWDNMAHQFFHAPGARSIWLIRKDWFEDSFQDFAQSKIDTKVELSDVAWQLPSTASNLSAPSSDDQSNDE